MKKQLFILGALCLGMLASFGLYAQTGKTADQLTRQLELLSAVDADKVTVVHEDKTLEIPENEVPQGGWFIPLYTAEGTIKGYEIQRTNKLHLSSDYPFSFSVDEKNHWQLQMTMYDKKLESHSSYHFFSEGTNTFDVHISDKFVDREWNVRDRTPDMSHPGSVLSGQIPIRNSYAGALWLSFCGGKYLAEQNGTNSSSVHKLVDMLQVTDVYPNPWWCDFHYQLSSFPNPLISTGSFVLNTNYITTDVEDYWQIREEIVKHDNIPSLLKELKIVLTNSVVYDTYELRQCKEVNKNLKVPVSVLIKSCGGIPYPAVSPDIIWFSYTIKVTNIVTTPRIMPLLPTFGYVSVEDQRFWYRDKTHFRGSILYPCTNEWEVALDSPKVIAAGSQSLYKRISDKPAKIRYYVGVAIILFMVLLFPIISVLKKKNQ